MKGYKEWHTSKITTVYHNNKKCKTGNNIELENVVKGKGGKKLCNDCVELNSKR